MTLLPLILSALFLVSAAVCKAVADTLADHFEASIFRWKDPRFWKKSVSWQYVGYLKYTKYHPDAWHLFNSAMIGSFLLFGILSPLWVWGGAWWEVVLRIVVLLAIAGTGFVLTFNLFYNKLLIHHDNRK